MSQPSGGNSFPDNTISRGHDGGRQDLVGKVLARNLGKVFHDSDQVIEARTGVKIPIIFELEGEAGFRARESVVLEELTALQGIVLATGGGACWRRAIGALPGQGRRSVFARVRNGPVEPHATRSQPPIAAYHRSARTAAGTARAARSTLSGDCPCDRGTGSQSVKSLVLKLQLKLAQFELDGRPGDDAELRGASLQ